MPKRDETHPMPDERSPPLERYLTVLETIGAAAEDLNLTEVAERCMLPVGTVHRLLQNLHRTGLVATVGAKRKDYRLGERLLRLLHTGSETAQLEIAVQPILIALANELRETCFLTRLVGHRVISLAWAVPERHGQQGYVYPGHVMPPHATASGKAIMAYQSANLINKALGTKLEKLTPQTMVRRADILREYAAVRDAGYAISWKEMEVGIAAFAVPIPIADVGVMYSIGITAFADRLGRRPRGDIIAALKASGEALGRALRDRPTR